MTNLNINNEVITMQQVAEELGLSTNLLNIELNGIINEEYTNNIMNRTRNVSVFNERGILMMNKEGLLKLGKALGGHYTEQVNELCERFFSNEVVVVAEPSNKVTVQFDESPKLVDENKTVEVLTTKEVFGKEFTIYGTVERPLFLAKDVADMIEYSKDSKGNYNVSVMLSKVDEDEKTKVFTNLNNAKVGSNTWFLTEDGLYEVLMQSRKPIAKEFKKNVKRILKEIRKTGSYNAPTPVADSYMIEDPIKRAERWIEEQKEKQVLEVKNKELEHEVRVNNERIANKKILYTTTMVAKKFGLTAQKLNNILQGAEIIYKKGKTYYLYANYTGLNLADYGEESGIAYAHPTLKWTAKGYNFLIDFLLDIGYETESSGEGANVPLIDAPEGTLIDAPYQN